MFSRAKQEKIMVIEKRYYHSYIRMPEFIS